MFRMMLWFGIALALVGGFPPATAAGAAATPRVHVIVIDQMVFGPMPADVRAGDIIEWVNHGVLEHTATARDGSFDVDLKPGAAVRMTAKTGSFDVFCRFHPTMQANLVVK
ncbi:cupredoxin domain-containing protein [Rhodanobacter lindaniclasticus]